MPAISQDTPKNGSTVTVKRGQTLVIKRAENATTGFRWSVDNAAEQILELKHTDYAAAGAIPGAGGERRFEFTAINVGEKSLSLKHWR